MVKSPILRSVALISLVTATWSIVGCSLTNLVDIRVGECSGANEAGHRRCQEVLNPEYGFYEGCAAFKCVELDDYFQCQAVDGEICDGQDNDCDYLIDESDDEGTLLETSSSTLVSGIEETSSVTLASSEQFGRSLYLQESRNTLLQIALDGDSSTTAPVGLRTQKANPDPASQAALTELQAGCYPASNSAPGSACSTEQAVTAAGENVGFFAYVNGQGCTTGELRVGVIEQNDPDEFIDRGLGARAPSYRGVHTQGSRCSDNLSQACSALKEQLLDGNLDKDERDELSGQLTSVCGVSHPHIAALPRQALVTYLGSKLSEPTCPKEDTNVLSLLVHESRATFDSTIYWGNPSADGVPEIIGATRSGLGASVVTLDDRGFLIAHGHAEGGIRLVWVPEQDAPDETAGTQCPGDDCDDRSGFETESLSGVEELSIVNADDTQLADGISSSILAMSDETVALLLTWVDGCALADGNLNLEAKAQLIHLDMSGDEPEVITTFDVISLGEVDEPPLSVVAEEDFVVAGMSRNGETADQDRLGGFYVFLRSSSSHLVRVTAFDGALVDDDEAISAPDWTYLLPLGAGEVVAHDERAGELKRVTIACDD